MRLLGFWAAAALLWTPDSVALALSNGRVTIQVCTGATCGKKAVAFGDDATEVDCLDLCSRGPNVRVLVDGAPSIFGADAMTTEERSFKCFFGVEDEERRLAVQRAAAKLADRVATMDTSTDPKKKSSSFFDAYSEAELRGLLDLHEALGSTSTNAPAVETASDVLDLHSAIQAIVEKKKKETHEPPPDDE